LADPTSDAFKVALAALRSKERTNAELTAWLERRGYGAEEVQAAIGRLVDMGELDDERFARLYAEDKRDLRGWGAERIREALLARGVPPSLAEAAVEADSHEAQVRRAHNLLTGRAQRLAKDADRARALGYLTRRGYEYEIAYEAIRLAARRAA
jgi:regulatory protein